MSGANVKLLAQAAVDLGIACRKADQAQVQAALSAGANPSTAMYSSDGKVTRSESELTAAAVTAAHHTWTNTNARSMDYHEERFAILAMLAEAGSEDAEEVRTESAQRLLGWIERENFMASYNLPPREIEIEIEAAEFR